MKKIGYFLMVGLAFTALQLSTVSAQTGMPPMSNHSGMGTMGDPNKMENRQDRRDNMQENRQDRRDNMQENRQDRRDNMQENRQDRRDNMQENRQDRRQDRRTGNQGENPVLTIGDPMCNGSSGPPQVGCPNYGQPPMGNHSGMPPMGTSNLGDHCGEIQAKNEKKRMRKEAKCLRRALNDHKPTVKIHDRPKDGLGAYGCGKKQTGSKAGQIACLRGLLNGPSGKPGMAPGTR